MNKIFFQWMNDAANFGTDCNTFVYLNPIGEDTYERIDMDNPPGEASEYDLEEFNDTFRDGVDINSFRLELVYED